MDNNTEARVQELVKKYKNLCAENNRLKTQLLAQKQLQSQLEEKNRELNQKLNRALMRDSFLMAEGDRAAAKKAVQAIIKEVDRCIRYLYN